MPSREELYTALRNADAAGDSIGAKRIAQYISSLPEESAKKAETPEERNRASLQGTLEEAGWLNRNLAGIGSAAAKTYYGAKQLMSGGNLSPEDQQAVKDWTTIEQAAPVGSVAGNIGMMVAPGLGLAGTAGKTAVLGKSILNPNTLTKAGAVGGGYMGLQPTEKQGAEGLQQRGGEALKGAAFGVAGQAIAQKVGTALANKYGARISSIPDSEIDNQINNTLKDSGQSIKDLPSDFVNNLRNQVKTATQSGMNLDIPSALRKAEFERAGITPTLGQVTRNPMQYATEQNLRGVAGVGEPLSVAFTNQENTLRSTIGKYAQGAADRYQAGTQIGEALTNADKAMSNQVSSLYRQAKQSAGKDLELPLQGLSQDYATILRDFGDKIPSGVRNNFEDLGLLTGKQNKIFTVEEADRLLKVINSNQSNDPAVNSALSALRNSVKGAVTEVDATGGVYAPAVKAAATRFKMHDMLPALQQAARGELDADKFVSKSIIGAKPESVVELTKLLKMSSPEAYQQAKSQVGEYLRRAAYGLDSGLTAGDTAFRPAGFAKALDSLGARLNAFYTPQEIQELRNLSRVGSMMNTPPAKAAVSTSSSAVPLQNALVNILGSKIPFASTIAGVAKGATTNARNAREVANALNANIPSQQFGLLPGEQERYINNLSRYAVPLAIGMGQ